MKILGAVSRGILALAMVTTAWTGTTVAGQEQNLSALKDFIVTAYPDLKGPDYQVAVSFQGEFDRPWSSLSLAFVSIHVHDHSAPGSHYRRVLSGRFHVVGSRVTEASFEGELIELPLSKSTAAEVRKKKGWTADDMIGAFARAGAKYVTYRPEDFTRAVTLDRFAPHLGRPIAAKARLIADLPQIDGVDEFDFEPVWIVDLETATDTGVRQCHTLSFEPFHARLAEVRYATC
jgi:hypothetical protein